ncbi:MAG: phosphoglycerate kinase [Lishizhenia sp.]
MTAISSQNFKNQTALIRVDFNVPLSSDATIITDDTRMRAALPTIEYILNNGGKVVLMSHLGRPKNGPEEKFSLKHLVNHLSKLLNREVQFAADCIGEKTEEIVKELKEGDVCLIENLRFYKEETAGDLAFAEKLSRLGDVYVNDAFGTAHRAHASTAVIAQFFKDKKCFGKLLQAEIESVEKVLNSKEKPVTAIVGGAKVSSKITIIERLLDKVDNLIIGGGMAYTFVKAEGGEVGNSLIEDDYLETAKKIITQAKAKNVKLCIPTDTIIADDFNNEANKKTVEISKIPSGWMGLDIAEESSSAFSDVITNSKIILWNGPMGVFEMENFQKGTVNVANAIVEATKNGAFSLVGGGDSVAAVNKFNLADKVSYVSTGGGAMLEYLEGKELPGIKAMNH